MAYPRGVHVDGGAPGGGSSFRQDAGEASPGSPDLETAATTVQRGYREKTSILGISSAGVIYRRRGAARGSTREPGTPWRGQSLGHATKAPGSLVVALWPHPGDSRRFRRADFLSNFYRILAHF